MSDQTEHLKTLFANASQLPTDGTFNHFGFLIDGASDDPIENIANIEPFKPVTLFAYHPKDTTPKTRFVNSAAMDSSYHGQKLGVIMARTPEAVKSLKDSLLFRNANNQLTLSNKKKLSIKGNSQLAFAGEMPDNLYLDSGSQLIADRDCRIDDVMVDEHAQVSLAPHSKLVDTGFFHTKTGTLDSEGNFIPGPVNMRDIASLFVNSQIAQSNLEKQLQTKDANLYNTLALDSKIIDSTVGYDDPLNKMPKIINHLVSANLNNSKIDSQYGSKLTKAQITDTNFQTGRLPVTVTNTKIKRSYISDAGVRSLHAAGEMNMKDSEISDFMTDHEIEADSSVIKGSEEKPIVATQALLLNEQKVNYPQGAIFAFPDDGKFNKDVDHIAKEEEKQQYRGRTDLASCYLVNPNNKAYQKLAKANNSKDNADFESYDLIDPITLVSVSPAESTKNRLLDPTYYAANSALFSETRDSLLAAQNFKTNAKTQDEPEL